MSESSFNPFSALANFFGGSSHSRLSSNLASIHQHVSQELEPDYFTEWEKGQQKRHRSDTTKSSSSSLFSHVSHEPITTRMYSALEEDRSTTPNVDQNEVKPTERYGTPFNHAINSSSTRAPKSGWSWSAPETIQVQAQNIPVPIASVHSAVTQVETGSK